MTARVLPVVAGLFLVSVLFRLGDGTALALAEGLRDHATSVPSTGQARSSQVACPEPPDMAAALAALRAREARIVTLEEALAQREATLDIARQEVGHQISRLSRAEESLRATLSLADEAAEADLATLTDVYQSMKPEQASALFAQMAPDFAAGFLGRMQPEAAAAIMAGLEPQVAYSISAVLAGRNARAPKQ
ncbi:flagellar motility protein MotE (MotC chaperone) [Rhodovulum bhavnagarense]|uniref:Flagellar motility protein MotE (MotC chaperone) n=1 Tax=Rhodovulum bhavnagarense TaxID=992286 RepID=A0A4R2RFR1_9RHOB|nr:hypothetical protein [Rhodovulum bhavnagarense]TCP61179.1 flagellar motility protein MotE (MotC chaperone) [Rhodovulum bhavnagarense]